MFTKKSLVIIVFTLLALISVGSEIKAQSTSVFVAGLKAPEKIIYVPQPGYFLVSEAGDAQIPNSGRISLITEQGARFTLLDGLPSGPATPNGESSGPSAMWLEGDHLFIAVGAGNEVLNGPFPGTEIPNPNPNSPLFSSVLVLLFHHDGFQPSSYNYQLMPADHARLANGETLILGNGIPRAALRLVGNFPDFTPDPRPNFAGNVRSSNPFGIVFTANTIYVADAAQNMVRTVNPINGTIGTLVTFPPRPNPNMPPIPPVIDAVPDGLRLFGNQLLVPLLTGAPFISGFAEVRSVDLTTGTNSPFISGLTSAIDVLPVSCGKSCNVFYTLEVSTNLPMGAPGRLQLFPSPNGPPTTIVSNLIFPTSMAFHPPSGDIFITEVFPGRITRVMLAP